MRMTENTVMTGQNHLHDAPPAGQIKAALTRPFSRDQIRFKPGSGEWYPYIEGDDMQDRLIEAIGNTFDLSLDTCMTVGSNIVVSGHLSIPGLGRRAGMGVQEHTSRAGKEMGADMLKGALADLMKSCLHKFDCGTQVRRMAPLKAPTGRDVRLNPRQVDAYLNRYFSATPPGGARPMSADQPSPTGPPDITDMRCEGCPTIMNQAQVAYSMHHLKRRLCNNCQKVAANG